MIYVFLKFNIFSEIIKDNLNFKFSGPFLFGFPHQLPGTQKIKDKKIQEVADASTGKADLMAVIKNPIFLLCSFGSALDAPLKTGLMNFGPKLMEVRFHVSSASAALASGIVCVPGLFSKEFFYEKFFFQELYSEAWQAES